MSGTAHSFSAVNPSGERPTLTTERRIVPGEELRRGLMSGYRALTTAAGEPHAVREDLVPGGGELWRGAARRRPLLTLTHLTDLQLADVNSPTRFEFFNRELLDPRFKLLVPTQRPYEAFNARTIEAMVNTLNRLASSGPVGGAPVNLAISTGDAIDNGQWNELLKVFALFDGGQVTTSGSGAYEGVQRPGWPDDIFWCPDGEGDMFTQTFGYPLAPGALAAASAPFASAGLSMPWLTAYGNHEGLIQGVGRITPELAAAMIGGRKPSVLPPGVDKDAAYELFTSGAQAFMHGAPVEITADPARRPVSRREFVEAHFNPGARPVGHGFGERNRRDGTAYYAYDLPAAELGGRYAGIRLIALDTSCLLGGADGAIDVEQLAWLESVLRESHSTHLSPSGEVIRGDGQDRLVILFSHHGLATLTNQRGWSSDGSLLGAGPDGHAVPVVSADEVEALLHRFPNVVLWLNGHTHTNSIAARRSPHTAGGSRGFWEVTTCSIVDWPNQSRIVELIDIGTAEHPRLAIACTMIDHDSPLAPRPGLLTGEGGWTASDLTALHRELAANVPLPGYGEILSGTPGDRNVILPL